MHCSSISFLVEENAVVVVVVVVFFRNVFTPRIKLVSFQAAPCKALFKRLISISVYSMI